MSVAARLAILQYMPLGGTGSEPVVTVTSPMHYTRVVLQTQQTASVVLRTSQHARVSLETEHNAKVTFR